MLSVVICAAWDPHRMRHSDLDGGSLRQCLIGIGGALTSSNCYS